jgi:WD40 repeat protein
VFALQNEIAEDAKEWEEHKRDASYLYSGARLSLAQEQVRDQKLLLSGLAKEFIQEGINVRDAELKAKETMRRRITAGLIAGIALALVLAGFAVYQMLQAKQQATIALARQLAAQAPALSASKAQTAVLLGVESMRLLPSVEASQILQTNSLPRLVASLTHNGPVHSVAFSPNGRYVVSGGCDQYKNNACTGGSARVWEATTGKEVARLPFDGEVFSSAFDPDGKYVASEGCDKYDKNNICIQGSARVWEAATGREISHMEYPGWVRVVTFSPDGKYVLSGGEDATVRVWEAATGKEIARRTHPGIVAAAAFSPDGSYVASGSINDDTTSVWETLTGRGVLKLDSGNAISVAFSPDGKSIVTGSGWTLTRDPGGGGAGGEYDAIVWDATTGKLISQVVYERFVSSVAFSPDGSTSFREAQMGLRLWKQPRARKSSG